MSPCFNDLGRFQPSKNSMSMPHETTTETQAILIKKRIAAPRPWADIAARLAAGARITDRAAFPTEDLVVMSCQAALSAAQRMSAMSEVKKRIAATPEPLLIDFLHKWEADPILFLAVQESLAARSADAQLAIRAHATDGGAKQHEKSPIDSLFKAQFILPVKEGYIYPFKPEPLYSRDYETERRYFQENTAKIKAVLEKGDMNARLNFFMKFNGCRISIKTWEKYVAAGNCLSFHLYAHQIKTQVETKNGLQKLGAEVFSWQAPQ